MAKRRSTRRTKSQAEDASAPTDQGVEDSQAKRPPRRRRRRKKTQRKPEQAAPEADVQSEQRAETAGPAAEERPEQEPRTTRKKKKKKRAPRSTSEPPKKKTGKKKAKKKSPKTSADPESVDEPVKTTKRRKKKPRSSRWSSVRQPRYERPPRDTEGLEWTEWRFVDDYDDFEEDDTEQAVEKSPPKARRKSRSKKTGSREKVVPNEEKPRGKRRRPQSTKNEAERLTEPRDIEGPDERESERSPAVPKKKSAKKKRPRQRKAKQADTEETKSRSKPSKPKPSKEAISDSAKEVSTGSDAPPWVELPPPPARRQTEKSSTDSTVKQKAPPKRRRKRAMKRRDEATPQEPMPESTTKKKKKKKRPVERQPKEEPARSKPTKKREVKPRAETGFGKLPLSDTMLDALDTAGYVDPTEIQAGLIPRAIEGVDVMGQARTGTGKTAAFCIPVLEQLEPHKRGCLPQAIALVPTRELAVQVRDECAKLSYGRKTQVVAVYGGKPIRQQIEKLQRGTDIVVGTPGRVLDLLDRRALVLNDVRFVVLDEADRMLDIGFRPDIEKILRRCPQSRQTLLLTATLPPPVERLAKRYMRDPETLNFSPKDLSVDTIDQHYFTVDNEQKFDLLVKLLQREKPTQAIVFCRTKRGTDRVHRRLTRKFPSAATIHGDLSQSVRDRVMRAFRAEKTQILVATDVVGRGIDVTSISHIINYDIPQFCDDYVHRVGRAGRMGREGVAFTFVTPEEGNELTRIEMRINLLLKRDEIAGFSSAAKPAPTEDIEIDELTGEPIEAPKPKPVYGGRSKRYRRAL